MDLDSLHNAIIQSQVDVNNKGFFDGFEAAYNEILAASKISSEKLVYLCISIAVIIVLYKFYKIYKESANEADGSLGIKYIFNIGRLYIGVVVAIMLSPVLINYCEKGFAEGTSYFTDTYKSSATENIEAIVAQWKEEDNKEEEETPDFVDNILSSLGNWTSRVLGSLAIYITRGIFFLFLSGRYLWLIILQLMMPFAIVFAIDKDTRDKYTYPFLKNLLCCYLLIPVFLIANNFAEVLVNILNTIDAREIITYSHSGETIRDTQHAITTLPATTLLPRWITMWVALVFKFYLFGKAAEYTQKIF
jgi:hypothetical protein